MKTTNGGALEVPNGGALEAPDTAAGRNAAGRTVEVICRHGRMMVPAVWLGSYLAVHLPPRADAPNGVAQGRGRWCVTHLPSGLSASGGALETSRQKAVQLARLWDATFASLDADRGADWQPRECWERAVRELTLRGEVWSPALAGLAVAETPAAEHAAVVHAVSGYRMGDGADEQYPARETVPADRLRDGPDGLEMFWRGEWWPVPTLGQVESWALDSCSETPDGRSVEPDHPEAWTRLLAVV